MKLKITVFVVLWALMSAFGIALYEKTKTVDDQGRGFVSVAGLDGDVYLKRYCNIYRAFRMKKRHPAEAIVAAPAFVVGSSIASKAGEEPAKIALILLSAALAVGTVWLLWLVTNDLGAVAIWLSFAYVWLLASAPELFAVSQAILIGTLVMVKRQTTDLRLWGGMVLLAGGTTVTNVVKPVAAFAVSLRWQLQNLGRDALRPVRGRDRARPSQTQTEVLQLPLRHKKSVAALLKCHARVILSVVGGLMILGVLTEVLKWSFIDKMSPLQEIEMGWDYIAKWFSGSFTIGERIRRMWEIFYLEPMMTHGVIFGKANAQGLDMLPLGYRMPIPHLIGFAIVLLCGLSAWRNRHNVVVRAALAMVAFDFLLHLVLGWGLVEAQIYCGHWFYVIPVLLAGLNGLGWKLMLAVVIAGWNLQFCPVLIGL